MGDKPQVAGLAFALLSVAACAYFISARARFHHIFTSTSIEVRSNPIGVLPSCSEPKQPPKMAGADNERYPLALRFSFFLHIGFSHTLGALFTPEKT